MKITSTQLAFAALFIIAAPATWAQGPGPDGPPMDMPPELQQPAKGPNAQQFLRQFSKELKLTDDQKSKIKPILEHQQDRIEALDRSSEQYRQRVQEIEQASWAEVRPILSAGQRKKFDVLTKRLADREDRAARRDSSDENGPPPPDGPPPGGGGPPE